MSVEIERKWRLAVVPNFPAPAFPSSIEQHYLITNPGELRIRRTDDSYTMTVKGDGTLARGEWEPEEDIPQWVFDLLKISSVGSITKTRYTVSGEAVLLEVDVYEDTLAGLVVVEAEWIAHHGPDVALAEAFAEAFVLPEWLGEAVEVTEDKRYKNKSLATHGLPN